MEQYLAGEEISEENLKKCIRKATISGAFVPVINGTAFKNKGVQTLLDAVVDYLPSPKDIKEIPAIDLKNEQPITINCDNKKFAGLAFKIMTDPFVGSLTFVRIYSGTLVGGTGAINTSDSREKQQVRDLSNAEQAVAVRCKSLLRAFKFNDAVAVKNDNARIHFGVMAQDVQAAFAAEGLNADNYALFCYDEWKDKYLDLEELVVLEDGTEEMRKTGERRLVRTAGNRFGVRYEELLCFIMAAI